MSTGVYLADVVKRRIDEQAALLADFTEAEDGVTVAEWVEAAVGDAGEEDAPAGLDEAAAQAFLCPTPAVGAKDKKKVKTERAMVYQFVYFIASATPEELEEGETWRELAGRFAVWAPRNLRRVGQLFIGFLVSLRALRAKHGERSASELGVPKHLLKELQGLQRLLVRHYSVKTQVTAADHDLPKFLQELRELADSPPTRKRASAARKRAPAADAADSTDASEGSESPLPLPLPKLLAASTSTASSASTASIASSASLASTATSASEESAKEGAAKKAGSALTGKKRKRPDPFDSYSAAQLAVHKRAQLYSPHGSGAFGQWDAFPAAVYEDYFGSGSRRAPSIWSLIQGTGPATSPNHVQFGIPFFQAFFADTFVLASYLRKYMVERGATLKQAVAEFRLANQERRAWKWWTQNVLHHAKSGSSVRARLGVGRLDVTSRAHFARALNLD